MPSLENVLKEIDAYNAKDPHGRELPYSEKLTGWGLEVHRGLGGTGVACPVGLAETG